MKAAQMWVITAILAAALASAAEPPAPGTYPLTPQPGRNSGRERHMLYLDKDGTGDMPFATASGKLRFRMVDERRVLIDRNDDGKADDADGPALERGLLAKIPIKLGGKPFDYPLFIAGLYSWDSNDGPTRAVMVNSGVFLEAHVGQTTVLLFDTNCNGRFGDIEDLAAKKPGDMLQIGADGKLRPMAKCFELDGKIQEFQIVNDAEALKLQPYTGPTATLKTGAGNGWKVEMRLRHADGSFVADTTTGGSVMLLPGTYRLEPFLAASPSSETGKNPKSPLQLYGAGVGATSVQIMAGENSLTFGPPLKLDFVASRSTEDDADVTVTDVTLTGAGGESYRADNCGAGGNSTITAFVRSGEKEKKVSSLAFG
ncbi:MAG: hypothetical protein NTW87_06675 [Planctomycetota bacterium]|nr:hypothetical protein [Planctomycetota bacterium]